MQPDGTFTDSTSRMQCTVCTLWREENKNSVHTVRIYSMASTVIVLQTMDVNTLMAELDMNFLGCSNVCNYRITITKDEHNASPMHLQLFALAKNLNNMFSVL